jgi:hypothetical protein
MAQKNKATAGRAGRRNAARPDTVTEATPGVRGRGRPDSSSAAVLLEALRSTLPALVVGVGALFAIRRLDDWDTWWHLATGRWIALHRSVPHTDPLSYATAGHPWIDNEWLYQLVLYALHQIGGANMLVLSTAMAFALSFALLLRNLRLALGPVGSAVLALWVMAIAQERFTIRPEVVSFVFLQIVLWSLATAPRDEGRRLWCLPLIMLLWANAHPLYVVGLFIIGCHMASTLLARLTFLPASVRAASSLSPRTTRWLLGCGALALVAPVLNPYWLSGALVPFQLFSSIDASNAALQSIGELRPPFSGYFPTLAVQAYQAFFVFSVAIVAGAGLASVFSNRRTTAGPARGRVRRRTAPQQPSIQGGSIAAGESGSVGRFDIGSFAAFCGLAYVSLLARRNMALFAMAVAPFVGQCLLVLKSRLPDAARRLWLSATTTLTFILPPALLAAAWFVASNGFYHWNSETHEFGTGILEINFPIRAAAFMKQMGFPPRLYNDVASGGYLTWDNPVAGGVYIDGRLGLDDKQFFSTYIDSLGDPNRWQSEAERFGVQTVLLFHRWENRRPLIRWLLNQPQWMLVYFDEVAVVFVHQPGNEALIEKCREQFPAWNEEVEKELLAPVSAWQWPIGQVTALGSYAALLNFVGNADGAVKYYARLLDLGLAPSVEVQIRVGLAYYYARRGDQATALMHLARAEQVDPQNPAVRQLRARLGSAGGR